MSRILRQELGAGVTSLVELVKRLQQQSARLTEFLQLQPEDVPVEEEAELAKKMNTDQHLLQRAIQRVTATLREYRDYMQQLSLEERTAEEAVLAAFPTFDDELHNIAASPEGQEQAWPIFRLLHKAKDVLDRIQVYLLTRPSATESSQRVSSRASAATADPPNSGQQTPKHRSDQIEEYLFGTGKKTVDPILDLSPSPVRRAPFNGEAKMGGNPHIVPKFGMPPDPTLPRRPQPYASRQQPTAPPIDTDDALRVNRIEIPKFGGAPEEWVTFWAAFDFAVHSRNYRNFQKHLLLLQYLEKGSPPRQMVEGYPPSDSNYPTVIRILQRKFGDERLRRDQLHAQLLHLRPAKNSLKELRQLQQEIDRICTQLDHLDGSDRSSVAKSTLIADIIKGKLPHAIVLELVKMEREAVVPWDAQDLREALATIVGDKEQADLCMRTFQEADSGTTDRHATHNKPPDKRHNSDRQVARQPPQRPATPPRYHNGYRPAENTRAFATVGQAEQQQAPQQAPQPPNRPWSNFCSLCSTEGHRPSHCPTYSTAEARRKRLEEQGRCLRCLRQTHATRDCNRQDECSKCHGRDHHFLLCPAKEGTSHDRSLNNSQPFRSPNNPQPNRPPFRGTGANAEPMGPPRPRAATHAMATFSAKNPTSHDTRDQDESVHALSALNEGNSGPEQRGEALLMTQTLKVSCHGGPATGIPAYVFYDPGSQTSYISRQMVDKLQPPCIGNQVLRIHTFAQTHPKIVHSPVVAVRLQRTDGGWEPLRLNVIDEIATDLRALQWVSRDAPQLTTELQATRGKLDILIGIREFWEVFSGQTPVRPGLHLINTIFGPMVGGEAELPERAVETNTIAMMTVNGSNLEAMPCARAVEDFWSIEAVGITGDPAQDDDAIAMRQFNETLRQLPTGRYSVRLSWRESHSPLPSNWAIAYRRLLSTTRRLQGSPEILEKYSAELLRQMEADIIEPTGRDEAEHFLPHQAVINIKKLRIVIDASAHAKNAPSLNDCLYRGPVLLPDLCGLLLRFRLCAVPLLADVQGAFHAIEVEPIDRQFCKVLWLKDPTKPVSGENLQIYRYKRLVFGATCSPFILAAVLLHHFDKHPPDLLARELVNNTYVDNLLVECETEEEAIKKAASAKSIFRDAEMNLREFLSHRPEVMQQIPEEDRLNKNPAKVLGLMWNTTSDTIDFSLPQHDDKPATRRSVLSALSSAFDPLGLIGPCLLPAKLLFQRLWETGSAWDVPIPEKEASDWKLITTSWQSQPMTLPRYAIASQHNQLQLHAFCDASETTFATAIYLRSESEHGIATHLLFSKNRLRPKKASCRFTVPRLELLALLIGSRALEFVEKELHRPIASRHMWSDSRIALAWIQSGDPKAEFERRRVVEIRQRPNITLHFTRTDENPADVASRGCTPTELQAHPLWWTGPQWLSQSMEEWPDELAFEVGEMTGTDEGEPPEAEIGTFATQADPLQPTIDPTQFSSMLKLLGITIIVLRFVGCFRPKFLRIGENLISTMGKPTGTDYRAARIFLLREDQRRLSPIKHPTIMNEDGLICLKTRMTNANGPTSFSAPILLDRHSPLTKLLITETHEDLKHAGTEWTLTEMLGRYWFPQARRTIKGVLRTCPSCRLINAPPFARPPMPPLPATRVKPANPFEFVGLDFAGPTPARDGNNIHTKTYIVIITCFVTRAVYLEPTRDLSAPTFINVLRRFFSRRGRPARILSDNAPTFIQAHKAIDILTGPPSDTDPRTFAARKGIQWDFIPAYSPWMGATYERLIGLVKGCVMKTIGRRILDYDDLSAFLAEVEASINSRPITWVSDHAESAKPLTPKDLIQPGLDNELQVIPSDLDYEDDNLSGPERLAALWKAYREAADHFWLRWSREYLLAIRERAGWAHKGPRLQTPQTPRIGQVVLIEEDFRPRNLWPAGRIVALNGQLSDIRSVQIRTPNGSIITRPVSRLCPLEAAIDESPSHKTDNKQSNEEVEDFGTIPPTIDEPGAQTQGDGTDHPQLDAQPTISPSNQHRMITRAKGRLFGPAATTTILAIMACLVFGGTPTLTLAIWPLADPATPTCTDNYVNCTHRGIRVHPANVQKVTICCMQLCFDRLTDKTFTYELSSDILVNDYTCSAWFWSAAEQPCVASASCAAVDECALIDCLICLEQLANWNCNPPLATSLALALLFTFGTVSGWIICCCTSTRLAFSIIGRLIAILLSWPIRWAFHLAGRPWTTEDKEQVAHRLEEGVQRVRTRAKTGIRNARQQGRQVQRAAARLVGILIILPGLALVAGETISITTSTETCHRTASGLQCTINSATVLTLLPAGQTSALLLRDQLGATLGTVKLRLLSLDMACHQRSEAWLRSYQVEVLSVKRCPRAGSCRGDHCDTVRPQTSVPELSSIQHFPGNTFCQPSTSFWANECALPASACLYHRVYARPIDSRPAELISCPSWDPQLNVQLQLELAGGHNSETEITLHPGITEHWTNISITPLAISVPPLPILGTKFIIDGQRAAMADGIPTDLHCPTEEAAHNFSCGLSLDACPECFADHSSGHVDCHCRDLDLNTLFANPELCLPITTAKVRLRNEGPAVYATHQYSPVQLHIAMRELRIVLQLTDSTCWLTDVNLHGCYRCSTGAQLSYTCNSDHDSPLASVLCEDGQLFAAHCSVNGTSEHQILPYSTAEVNTECQVRCSAGATKFRLNGTLSYIPRRRRMAHTQRSSERAVPDPETFSFLPDFGFDILGMLGWIWNIPFILSCLGIGILSLVVLYLLIRLSPIFRTYKLLTRIAVGMSAWGLSAAEHAELRPLADLFHHQIARAEEKQVPNWLMDKLDTIITFEVVSWVLHILVGISAIFAILSILWLLCHLIPRTQLRHNRNPRPSPLTQEKATCTTLVPVDLSAMPSASDWAANSPLLRNSLLQLHQQTEELASQFAAFPLQVSATQLSTQRLPPNVDRWLKRDLLPILRNLAPQLSNLGHALGKTQGEPSADFPLPEPPAKRARRPAGRLEEIPLSLMAHGVVLSVALLIVSTPTLAISPNHPGPVTDSTLQPLADHFYHQATKNANSTIIQTWLPGFLPSILLGSAFIKLLIIAFATWIFYRMIPKPFRPFRRRRRTARDHALEAIAIGILAQTQIGAALTTPFGGIGQPAGTVSQSEESHAPFPPEGGPLLPPPPPADHFSPATVNFSFFSPPTFSPASFSQLPISEKCRMQRSASCPPLSDPNPAPVPNQVPPPDPPQNPTPPPDPAPNPSSVTTRPIFNSPITGTGRQSSTDSEFANGDFDRDGASPTRGHPTIIRGRGATPHHHSTVYNRHSPPGPNNQNNGRSATAHNPSSHRPQMSNSRQGNTDWALEGWGSGLRMGRDQPCSSNSMGRPVAQVQPRPASIAIRATSPPIPSGGFGSRPPHQLRPSRFDILPTPRFQRIQLPNSLIVPGVRADQHLSHILGNGWWRTPQGRQQAEQVLSNTILRHHQTGHTLEWHAIADRPSTQLHIRPSQTVAEFWRRQRPLERADLPPLIQYRGVRGTSHASLRRQQQSGRTPWHNLRPHIDFHPLEFYICSPPANLQYSAPGTRTPSPLHPGSSLIPLHIRFRNLQTPSHSPIPHFFSRDHSPLPQNHQQSSPQSNKSKKGTKKGKGSGSTCRQNNFRPWPKGPPPGGTSAGHLLFIASITLFISLGCVGPTSAESSHYPPNINKSPPGSIFLHLTPFSPGILTPNANWPPSPLNINNSPPWPESPHPTAFANMICPPIAPSNTNSPFGRFKNPHPTSFDFGFCPANMKWLLSPPNKSQISPGKIGLLPSPNSKFLSAKIWPPTPTINSTPGQIHFCPAANSNFSSLTIPNSHPTSSYPSFAPARPNTASPADLSESAKVFQILTKMPRIRGPSPSPPPSSSQSTSMSASHSKHRKRRASSSSSSGSKRAPSSNTANTKGRSLASRISRVNSVCVVPSGNKQLARHSSNSKSPRHRRSRSRSPRSRTPRPPPKKEFRNPCYYPPPPKREPAPPIESGPRRGPVSSNSSSTRASNSGLQDINSAFNRLKIAQMVPTLTPMAYPLHLHGSVPAHLTAIFWDLRNNISHYSGTLVNFTEALRQGAKPPTPDSPASPIPAAVADWMTHMEAQLANLQEQMAPAVQSLMLVPPIPSPVQAPGGGGECR